MGIESFTNSGDDSELVESLGPPEGCPDCCLGELSSSGDIEGRPCLVPEPERSRRPVTLPEELFLLVDSAGVDTVRVIGAGLVDGALS